MFTLSLTNRRVRWTVGSIAMLALCLFAAKYWSGGNKRDKGAKQPALVRVATAVKQDVPLQLRTFGTVEASATVAVRALATGELRQVFFKPGARVHRGDRLFSIDSRSYAVSLRQAQAAVAKDLAQLSLARATQERDRTLLETARQEHQRYEGLVQQHFVPQEQADQYRNALATAEAALHADEAAIGQAQASAEFDRASVDNAKLQLSYTEIHAPVDGVAGDLLAKPGDQIKAQDSGPLVTIAAVQPIYVTFSLAERDFATLRQQQNGSPIEVNVFDGASSTEPLASGHLVFVDNAGDTATGTMKLKGEFANLDGRLWPGRFVDVAVRLGTATGATVIPQAAVQVGQNGTFAFVVGPDQKVHVTPVKVRDTVGQQVIIESGVQPGEKVVTDGQLQLVEGTQIEVSDGTAKGTAGAGKGKRDHGGKAKS